MSQRSDISRIKEGDRFSLIRYCEVTEVRDTKFTVKTDNGDFWQVDKPIVGRSCYTANQAPEEKKVTHTQIAYAFERAGDVIFTVCFRKKAKPEDVADAFTDMDEDPRSLPQAKRRKIARSLLQGPERIMKGYLLHPEPDVNGRMKVHDLEVTEGSAERLVDPRTIEWLILKNVKYVT